MAKKVFLTEDEMPRQWYNILADIKMNPPLGPDGNPVSPDQLAPVFPMNLIEQEVSAERWITIPEAVLDVYRIWRPSPLVRAEALDEHRTGQGEGEVHERDGNPDLEGEVGRGHQLHALKGQVLNGNHRHDG